MDKILNKKIDVLLSVLISILILLASEYSLIFSLSIPIFMAIKLEMFDNRKRYIYLILLGLLSSILNLKLTFIVLLPSMVFSLLMIFLIRKDIDDKRSVFLLTSVLSIFTLLVFGYIYSKGYIDFKPLIEDSLKYFKTEQINLDKNLIINAIKTIPAISVTLNLIYVFISLKLVRNYLNYKNNGVRDLMSINEFRLEAIDMIILLLLFLLISFYAYFLGIDLETIRLNGISVFLSLFEINGILLIDYFFKKRSKLSRIINWVFMFLMFTILSSLFEVIGLVDIFINLRKKVRRE